MNFIHSQIRPAGRGWRRPSEASFRWIRALTASRRVFLTVTLIGIWMALLGGFSGASAASSPGKHTIAGHPEPPGCLRYALTELFFGTNKPGGVVSERQFQEFVDTKITPRFPDGLTLLTGYGQYRGSDSKVDRERSKVLILLYPESTGMDDNKKIEQIRNLYKQAFSQESVLRVDEPDPACVTF